MTAPLFLCTPQDCRGHLTYEAAKECAGGDLKRVGYLDWLGMWYANGKRRRP